MVLTNKVVHADRIIKSENAHTVCAVLEGNDKQHVFWIRLEDLLETNKSL